MQPVAHFLRAQYCHRKPNVTLICIPGSGISEIAGIVSRIVHSNTWFQITGVAAVSIRAYVAGNDYIRTQKPLSQYVEESTWNYNAKRRRDGKPEGDERNRIPVADLVHGFDGWLPLQAAAALALDAVLSAVLEAHPAAAATAGAYPFQRLPASAAW